jgi:hypothetical protein
MAKLSMAARKKMPASQYALKNKRFPINDKNHARVAKSFASRMSKRGQLSSGDKAKVDKKANRMLGLPRM